MNRYLDENGRFVKAIIKPKVKHSNPEAEKHNEKAIESNKTKTPLDEEKPEKAKGFLYNKKKKTKKKSE